MPLIPGKSRAAFSHNVAELYGTGRPIKQDLAIAYKEQRKGKKPKK